jgi:hypothetical protein
MGSHIVIRLLLICVFFCALSGCSSDIDPYATWQELGTYSAQGEGIASGNVSRIERVVVASDETVYVLWRGLRFDNRHYLKGWNGSTWEWIDIPARPDAFFTHIHEIAITQNNQLIVVWQWVGRDFAETFVGIWDGHVWQLLGDGPVTTGGVNYHLMSIREDEIYLVWTDQINELPKMNMRVWNGEYWQKKSDLDWFTIETEVRSQPVMAITPTGILYLAWSEETGLGEATVYDIYVMKWDGNNWIEVNPGSASGGGISNSPQASIDPNLVVTQGESLFVTWREFSLEEGHRNLRVLEGPIRVKHWNKSVWTDVGFGLSNNDGIDVNRQPSSPKLSVLANQIYLTWASGQGSAREVYVQRWDGTQWHDVGYDASRGESVSQNNSFSDYPKIAASEQKICVAWLDYGGSVIRVHPELTWDRGPELSIIEKERRNSIYLRCYTGE